MNPLMRLKKPLVICYVALALSSFGIPLAQAVIPAPDGGYPRGNTAEGQAALLSLTTGGFNTAVGFFSLKSDIAGGFNTAIGAATLLSNTADQNTAMGAAALLSNTSGQFNTAVGAVDLFSNTTGSNNTATGQGTLFDNTTGSFNTAMGSGALSANITGNNNTAVGASALSNTTGNNNIALGSNAGSNLTASDDNIDIGTGGVDGDAGTIRIGDESVHGATFIAGISGQNATGGDAVFVTSTGKLGTVTVPSSARFKDDIKPMDKASEVILALKPVTFHYKKELDSRGVRQFGLVAEEVEKIAPDLVKRDRDGNLQTVRYDQVNAMLLNEFLKEHRHVQEQDAIIARQQKQIDALTAGLQKVSADLQLGKPETRVIASHQ